MATSLEQPIRTRIESDSMGKIEVPADVYWGAQTQRSLLHFDIGRDTMPPELIHAFGLLKKACALVNQDLGKLSADKAHLIVQAANEVIDGRHANQHECERGHRQPCDSDRRRRDGIEKPDPPQ
jgi:fumarate hydratase class II